MHLQRGHLVHNSELTVAMDPNFNNILRDIQEQLQLMRANINNMSNQMNNFSEMIESIETLQIRQSSKSVHFNDNSRHRQRPIPCRQLLIL